MLVKQMLDEWLTYYRNIQLKDQVYNNKFGNEFKDDDEDANDNDYEDIDECVELEVDS